MAMYHLSATVVQRSKGHSAIAGAAYRSGTLLQDRASGKAHDYQHKRGIAESQILAPEHAPDWVYSREELWNRAERAEKRWDAQPAREIRLALPHELTDRERADLVYSYAQEMFVSRGMVADIAIHRPDRNGDERNDHAHILLTMRELDGEGFSAKKQRDWNNTELLERWREEWEVYQNRALEEAGFEERVDHRTLEAQGSLHEPTLHLGKDATTLERAGIATRIGDENREIRARNAKRDALVHELAALDAEIATEMHKEFVEEPPPEPLTADTQEEQKAIPQSIFDSAVYKAYEDLLFGKPKEEAPRAAAVAEHEDPTPENSRDLFSSPVFKAYEKAIRERGEIREFGLGKNWYDSTVTMFENIYYDTIHSIKKSFDRYVGRAPQAPDKDDHEPSHDER